MLDLFATLEIFIKLMGNDKVLSLGEMRISNIFGVLYTQSFTHLPMCLLPGVQPQGCKGEQENHWQLLGLTI